MSKVEIEEKSIKKNDPKKIATKIIGIKYEKKNRGCIILD
jgi:hypothetical protein